ncbi:MAG: rubrerythrin family protein [Oscillospiraceae bacterium]
MELAQSKTMANLITAFAGESQASVKYGYYSEKAKKDGFEQIADIFAETSKNEAQHAKIWYKQLNGEIKDTLQNLEDAANGENFEWSEMYAEFARVAQSEGFVDIERLFLGVGDVEKAHEERYLSLISNINNSDVFKKNQAIVWHCKNCGHLHIGKEAPAICPVCSHKQSFFEEYAENY